MRKSRCQFTVILSLLSALMMNSCSKSATISSKSEEKTAIVEFVLKSSEYEAVKSLNRAATLYHNTDSESNVVRNVLDVGKDFLLIAELSPEVPIQTSNSKAAIETDDLEQGIRYRVVVYDEVGAYVTQQEYVRGSEASSPEMLLDGGSTYTFVVYSVNTTASLPGPTFVGGLQTLLASEVTVAGNQDFMYFQQDLTLEGGNTPNRLNIVLKHRFSQITTIIDASQTGYNPVNITASFGPHSNTAIVSLATGIIVRGAQTERSSVTRSFTSGTTTDSYPTIINADANVLTNYVIASLTIGELTLTDMTPFTALTITPGVKYNLTLRITPTDEVVTGLAAPAVRINGRVWLRHNLGANTLLDPDQLPQVAALHGHYYQWGRLEHAATVSNGPGAISGWNTSNARPANSWNTGTNALPIKTLNDPCPAGFRVPTEEEFVELFSSTIESQFGVFQETSTNFAPARIFTSKRTTAVKITFPMAGGRHPDAGELRRRGLRGFYSTNRKSTNIAARRLTLQEDLPTNNDGITFDNSPVSWASSVRCINQ